MTNTVEFSQVSRRFGTVAALDRIDLEIPSGCVYGLLGPNGAGKTTALNLMTTLLRPSEGAVRVLGLDAVKESDEVRRRIGFVPEDPLVYSGLTGREFVELSATLHGVAQGEVGDRSKALLETFDLLGQMDNAMATYSKGMRRKALIASALVCEPELLVLDEPMEGLDVYAQGLLKDILKKRAASGKTVVYSTHIVEVADGLCTHLCILDKGHVVAAGAIADVREKLGAATLEQAFENRLKRPG